MNRRNFFKSGVICLLGVSVAHTSAAGYSIVKSDNVTFRWRHSNGTLQCRLIAPTAGWVAAGFNDSEALANTWFVMGDLSSPIARIEEHIAMPPNHQSVQSLGLESAIVESGGQYSGGYSTMNFMVSQKIPSRPGLNLKRGNSAYLMLAWSHESDFEHHSMWRKHVAIIL